MADPWRHSGHGISVALRVTPRGGRDGIDGVETLADGGQANRAVTELLAKALAVPRRNVRIIAGATSRLKQLAVEGDPEKLGQALRALTSGQQE